MMEKFFSFMSFYEQHQQAAPAQSNNIDNNNRVTPMSLDSSSYARGNQQQPTFAPYEPQRGSISFTPHQQPSPGKEKSLDALQGIHLEADTTTQEFTLYHGKGGLYIGKSFLKNNVFVLDFVPDQGTADSDAIVNFASWSHPPDLDPDFSPEGFCSRDNIGSSRDNIGSSRNNIGSSRDNISNSRDNTGSTRGNTDYNTNRGSFNGTSSHRRYSTDSCAAVDSHSTRSSQKRQPHCGILL
ncbi:unnamed protein product [Closterium sp. NIES-54]